MCIRDSATASVDVEARLQQLCEGASGSPRATAARPLARGGAAAGSARALAAGPADAARRGPLLPPGLADIVLSQLDRLSLSEQLVVKMACALGRRFERSVLQALYPGGAAELDEALAELTHHHYVTCIERLPNDARHV